MTITQRQRLLYVLTDYVMLNIGWLVFTFIRYAFLPYSFDVNYPFLRHLSTTPVLAGIIFVPLLMIALYWLSGYYNQVFFKSRVDETVNTATISTVGTLLVLIVVLLNDMVSERIYNYELLVVLWACFFVPVFASRSFITERARRRIYRREIFFNTLVAGTGKSAQALARKLSGESRGNGFNITGFIETNSFAEARTDTDLPIVDEAHLPEFIREHNISRIVLGPQHNGMRSTSDLISRLLPLGCRIYVTPDMHSLIFSRPRIANVVNEPLIDVSSSTLSPFIANSKRTADVIVSAITMVMLLPIYLLLLVIVKLDSKGPALYRQERIGYRKRPFKILKFRTMKTDAEINGPSLSSLDDPRITRIGHYLRKYRLDELPQFWNVLVGDMSLVGPRPERQFYITQIVKKAPLYNLVHQVRPGITSWGMVKYGYASNVDQMVERLRYDLIYLENISLGVDLKILFHTVNTVITGRGL